MEEILMSRDTTIFLLQYLYFILNMEKSILTPVQEIEFLGLTGNSVKMTLSFPEQQIKEIQDQCQDLCLKADKTYRSFSFNNPSCITGTIKLSISSAATDKCSKTQWVISRGPVPEQGVKEGTTVVDSKLETLPGSVENTTSVLCYNKKRCLQEVVGCILSRDTTRRGMDIRGKGNAHKYFGTESSEASFNIISQTNENESSTFSNRQHNCLDVLTKNGRYWEQETFGLDKRYVGMRNGITITAEYLPSCLNVEADCQSRNPRDSWKPLPQMFHQICQITGTPEIDLSASQLSHQLPKYFALRLDPYSQGTDVM